MGTSVPLLTIQFTRSSKRLIPGSTAVCAAGSELTKVAPTADKQFPT